MQYSFKWLFAKRRASLERVKKPGYKYWASASDSISELVRKRNTGCRLSPIYTLEMPDVKDETLSLMSSLIGSAINYLRICKHIFKKLKIKKGLFWHRVQMRHFCLDHLLGSDFNIIASHTKVKWYSQKSAKAQNMPYDMSLNLIISNFRSTKRILDILKLI